MSNVSRAILIYSAAALAFVYAISAAQAQQPKFDLPPLTAAQQARLLEGAKLSDDGIKLCAQGNMQQGLAKVRQATAISVEVLGMGSLITAEMYTALGAAEFGGGDLQAAKKAFETALAIKRKADPNKNPELSGTLDALGLTLTELGDYATAQKMLNEALAIRSQRKPLSNSEISVTQTHLGYLASKQGNYQLALQYMYSALKIQFNDPKLFKKTEMADTLSKIGRTTWEMGEYTAARTAFEQSLAVQTALHGADSVDAAAEMLNMGGILLEIGDLEQSRTYFTKALKIQEAKLGRKHADTASTINNLGLLLLRQDQPGPAKERLETALAIRREIYGDKNPLVAVSLMNVGLWYQDQQDFKTAGRMFDMALATEKLNPVDHVGTGTALYSCATASFAVRDYKTSRDQFENAGKIFNKIFTELHPYSKAALYGLAQCDVVTGNWEDAGHEAEKGRRLSRQIVDKVLPGMTESQQLSFLQVVDVDEFHGCLTFGLTRKSDPWFRELSAGWVLNGKALTQQALAERALLTRNTPQGFEQQVKELTQVRQQLATLSMSAPDPSQADARKKQLAELQDRQDRLSREIDVGGRFSHGDKAISSWIELPAVRKAIPAGAVLVEFARFRWLDFTSVNRKNRWLPAHYAAWIIPSAGVDEVQLIDLGDADAIDKQISEMRSELQASNAKLQKLGEVEAEAALKKPLGALSKQILAPLVPHLGDAKQLILCPDASLWLVPWSALSVDEKTYAIERWEINYLVSGRDLAKAATAADAFKTTAPTVFADPDYDFQRPPTTAAKPASSGLPAMPGMPTNRGLFSSVLAAVQRLPGTLSEAKAILPSLKSLSKIEPTLFTDKRATESTFQSLQHPKTLVLSTHGFFLPDQEVKTDTLGPSGIAGRATASTVDGKTLENPLLRCGLLLAGCNKKAAAGDSSDDGILTGLEIINADLRGTDLVVLSACDTGLGKVRNGEGVAGLRQAFQLAGAKSVVATLWQIPDQATAQLMNDFFANLANKQTNAAALRNAQLSRLKARRDKYGAAHPLFWAAFTLTGQ